MNTNTIMTIYMTLGKFYNIPEPQNLKFPMIPIPDLVTQRFLELTLIMNIKVSYELQTP